MKEVGWVGERERRGKERDKEEVRTMEKGENVQHSRKPHQK